MRRGRVGDPGAAGDGSKAEILRADILKSANGRRDQSLAKVSLEMNANRAARAWGA
jgi:hypothetical protein